MIHFFYKKQIVDLTETHVTLSIADKRVYQHNEKWIAPIELIQPAKLKICYYFLKTTRTVHEFGDDVTYELADKIKGIT